MSTRGTFVIIEEFTHFLYRAPDTPFGNKLGFGDLFAEIDSSMGWVQSAKWSPSGQLLGFVGKEIPLIDKFL